jgi:hypothetical protein
MKNNKNMKYFSFVFVIVLSFVLFLSSSSLYVTAENSIDLTNEESKNSKIDNKIRAYELNELDKFGITKIYQTIPNGRDFFSHWDEGEFRVLHLGERDVVDSELIIKGKNAELAIDGNGIATLQGKDPLKDSKPRIYVYDKSKPKWDNVEITVYAKRISEINDYSYAGINIGARSEHQDVDESHLDAGQTYYGRFTYDNRIYFAKEIQHGEYSFSKNKKFNWNTNDESMPKDLWIGLKFIVRTIDSTGNVKLELYTDLTDGQNGGTWEKKLEFIDDGSWDGNRIFNESGTSVFIRNDGLGMAQYKNFSIREINPIS